jgi:hypothetical protein
METMPDGEGATKRSRVSSEAEEDTATAVPIDTAAIFSSSNNSCKTDWSDKFPMRRVLVRSRKRIPRVSSEAEVDTTKAVPIDTTAIFSSSNNSCKTDPIVTLNVRGTMFQVARATLLTYPESKLARLVSDPSEDHNNKTREEDGRGEDDGNDNKGIYLDLDESSFKIVLDFLRYAEVALPKTMSKVALLEDLELLGIPFPETSNACIKEHPDKGNMESMFDFNMKRYMLALANECVSRFAKRGHFDDGETQFRLDFELSKNSKETDVNQGLRLLVASPPSSKPRKKLSYFLSFFGVALCEGKGSTTCESPQLTFALVTGRAASATLDHSASACKSRKRSRKNCDPDEPFSAPLCSSKAATESMVTLNVGGTHFQVDRSSLLKHPDSMLARLVSDTWMQHRGADETPEDSNTTETTGIGENPKKGFENDDGIFIDRDGDKFKYVLSFLDNGKVELPKTVSKAMFLKDLDYFGIPATEAESCLVTERPSKGHFRNVLDFNLTRYTIALANDAVTQIASRTHVNEPFGGEVVISLAYSKSALSSCNSDVFQGIQLLFQNYDDRTTAGDKLSYFLAPFGLSISAKQYNYDSKTYTLTLLVK